MGTKSKTVSFDGTYDHKADFIAQTVFGFKWHEADLEQRRTVRNYILAYDAQGKLPADQWPESVEEEQSRLAREEAARAKAEGREQQTIGAGDVGTVTPAQLGL